MTFSYDENQANQISNLANGVISFLENQGPAKIEKNYQDELLMKVLYYYINKYSHIKGAFFAIHHNIFLRINRFTFRI